METEQLYREVVELILLIGGAAAVAGVARRFGLSAPLFLVVVGLLVGLIPGLPSYGIAPQLVLLLFLPPLLFAAAWESSYLGIRANLRPILLLSVGLVLFTTVVVGFVASAVVAGLGLAAAFTLGAIVAPPDAVAATAIGRRVGLPRRLVTILAGESLINDATALTAYRVAVLAATGGGFSLVLGLEEFALAGVGGVAVGLALAVVVQQLLLRTSDSLLENTATLLTPFVAWVAAEEIHSSGVLAVVVAGLWLGHRAPRILTSPARLEAAAVWGMINFLLETVVFLLIGLQVPVVLDSLSGRSTQELVTASLAVTLAVILARFVWVFPATYLTRMVSRRLRERDPAPPWQWPFVLSWAGMRGVVSLAAAFALPPDFPQRDMLVFISFVVVIVTLVVQGFSLPALIRRLGVTAPDEMTDRLAEAAAQHRAAQAALERLDAIVEEMRDELDGDVVERVRQKAEMRMLGAWERLGGPSYGDRETPTATYRRLRREMLDAERKVFVELRDQGRIDDEVLRRVLWELDLEHALLARD